MHHYPSHTRQSPSLLSSNMQAALSLNREMATPGRVDPNIKILKG